MPISDWLDIPAKDRRNISNFRRWCRTKSLFFQFCICGRFGRISFIYLNVLPMQMHVHGYIVGLCSINVSNNASANSSKENCAYSWNSIGNTNVNTRRHTDAIYGPKKTTTTKSTKTDTRNAVNHPYIPTFGRSRHRTVFKYRVRLLIA